MKMSHSLSASLFIALIAVGACGFADQSPSADPAITCAGWTEMTEAERISHADRVVGDSADLLNRIRVRQQRPVGTERGALIVDVVQSVTKGCGGWATPDQSIEEVVDSLY